MKVQEQMDVILWIIAFVGVALIYGAKPIYKLFAKNNESDVVVNIFKGVGTLLSIGGIALLYMQGYLI